MKSVQKRVLLCALVTVISVVAAYLISLAGGKYMQGHFGSAENCEIASESEVIDETVSLEQNIDIYFDHLTGIGISIAHLSQEEIAEEAGLAISVSDGEKVLYSGVTGSLRHLDYLEDSFGKLRPQAHYLFSIPEDVYIGEGEYTVTVTGVNLNREAQIALGVSEDTVYLRTEGELIQHPQERFLFTLLYVAVFALILVRMLWFKDEADAFEVKKLDRIIVFYTLFLFTFTFTYYEDTILIYENARVMKSAIRHGEFFRYYDYAMIHSRFRMSANYNVIMYIIFAICFLPYDILCAVFGEVPLYYGQLLYNVIISILFVFTGWRLRCLLKVWEIDGKTKDLVGVLYYMNPLLLYGTVGFCQMDMFYVAVFIEGLILFEKHKTDKACLVWSLAVAMKTFPLLVILPLILLREKKLLQILRYIAEVMSFSLVCHLIYGSSEGWSLIQQHNPHYEKLFENMIASQHSAASVFMLLYLLLLFYCWTTKRKESYRTTIMCGVAVYMTFFCFCDWFAQYLVLGGLFLALAVLLAEDLRIYFGIETFLSLGFILSVWLRSSDGANLMIQTGCIGAFRYVYDTPLLFSQFVDGVTDFAYPLELAQSISVAAGLFLFLYCWYCMKKQKRADNVFPAGYLYLPMMPVFAVMLLSGIITFSS